MLAINSVILVILQLFTQLLFYISNKLPRRPSIIFLP